MLHHACRIAPVTFGFVASGGGLNTSTVAIPSSARIGDLCLYFVYSGASYYVPGISIPTNYTLLGTYPGANIRANVCYKLLVSGDPGSNIGGLSGTPSFGYILHNYAVLRPSRAVLSLSYGGMLNEITDAAPALKTVLASGAPSPRLVFGCAGQESAFADPSWSPNPWDNSVTGYSSAQRIAYKNQMLAEDLSSTFQDTGNKNNITCGWISAT